MKGFIIRLSPNEVIRFHFYHNEAPVTAEAFAASLPFSRSFMHARVSGQEIWTDDAPEWHIIQENASVFTEPGEVVLGPVMPLRSKTRKAIGIYYGEGRGLDAGNIFGRVFDEDLPRLKILGEQIWKQGIQTISFEKNEE